MGISDILARVKGLVIRPPVDLVEGRYFYATVTPDDKAQRVYTYNASQAELLMRATGYVNICAAMNAMYCASVPIRLYTKAGKGRKVKGLEADWLRRGVKGKAAAYADNAKNITEVEDAPANALLSNPNFTDTGIEFRRLLFYFLDINGNAYVQHDASANAPPKNLLTLYPQWTVPSIGDDGIFAYRYGRNYTGREEIPASNVIQFKHMPSPQNPWMGVGCLNGVTVEADIYASAVVYEQSFWNNGARPDYSVMLPKGSTQAQIDQTKALLERRHQGARKGGKPIVVSGDEMTIQPLQWSPREMEYGDGMDRMRRTILNAFGVPLALLEMSDKSLGGGGREFEARQQYLSQTIANRLSSVCERLNENYLPTFGYKPGEVWYAYDNPDTEDQKTVEEQSRLDVDLALRTINEARAIRGLDPLPDGDELRYKGTLLADVGKVSAPVDPLTGKPKEKPTEKPKTEGKTFYSRSSLAGKGETPRV